jgi:glycine betaine/proline transport system ATP-binding protein
MRKNNHYIRIEDLQLVFGQKKARTQAIELLENGATNNEIREATGCAVGVRNVSLDIKKGELFVIVGLSGSGKSSLIRCFNGLNTPTDGTITIDGFNVTEASKEDLIDFRRNKVSMVFQSFGLLSHRSVLRNVEYGLEVRGDKKDARVEPALVAIKAVGLEGWEHYYPHQLSGGMKQRVGLARAVAANTEVLLMDEPYSALDPLIRRDMQNELLNLEDYMDKTIIFITHDMNEAFKLGDRIALMKDGEIVQLGTPTQFFNNPANSYVEDFIADVDKTQVLHAKQVMQEIEYYVNPNTTVKEANEYFKSHEDETFLYVTDENDKLLGYISRETCQGSKAKTVKSLVNEHITPFNQYEYLKDLLPLLQDTEYSVPITDKSGRLKGTVCLDVILDVLT